MGKRIVIAGATGLIGRQVAALLGTQGAEVHVLARRAVDWSAGVTAHIAEPKDWSGVVAGLKPDILISCLGTTWRAAGKSEAAFRAVDQDLVLAVARAARDAGARQCIAVSSIGASAKASGFYLRVKGEVEEALAALGVDRHDLIQPGLLRGARGGERRAGERLAIMLSPLTDAMTAFGTLRKYRSIASDDVARAIVALTNTDAPGRFVHQHDALMALARG